MKDELLRFVENYQCGSEVSHIRIMLYGPIATGKSSFVNSTTTAVLGRMAIGAGTNRGNERTLRSYTTQYKVHKIRRGKEVPRVYYPMVFNDIMGLEDGEQIGVCPQDIDLVMKGHVKDGYKFNPRNPLSPTNSEFYNPNPNLTDRVHVLVCVLSANVPAIPTSIIKKMKEVRERAHELGIPQVAILTNIDSACAETQKDVKNVYRSKHLLKKMDAFSATVGIPINCIFPIKNYSEGNNEKDEDMDTLILTALKHMLNFGDDFIDSVSD